MMNLLTILYTLSTLYTALPQSVMPGSQTDSHNCVMDGGFQWCETTHSCVRPWETPCADCSECMPVMCPMPAISVDCRVMEPLPDECGCTRSCPTVDCSTASHTPASHTPQVSGIGGTCGGFMPYNMISRCDEGLECVNTLGPMIADAPGQCLEVCHNFRDSRGNCVEKGCNSWSDGCNICDVNAGVLVNCSERQCIYQYVAGAGQCLSEQLNTIPTNCLMWYDGCNSCSVKNGIIQGCTMMYCLAINNPHCETFTTGPLMNDEICYRFCEDNSQSSINRVDSCPNDSYCGTTTPSLVSYDTCGERAYKCVTNSIDH